MRAFALNSVLVSIANASVYVANYIVIAAIAAFFGATWQTDAFFLAFSFPAFFVGAIVSAVGSVFIPVFAECKINRPAVLGKLIGSALFYVLSSTLLITLLVGLIAVYISNSTMFPETTVIFRHLVIQQTLLLLPVIVIQTLTGVITAFYNANGRFLYPPLTDAISTFAVLVMIVAFKPALGIFSVPLGFLSGAVLHLLLLAAFWKRFDVNIVWTWEVESDLRRSLKLSLPLILGTAMLQFGSVIARFLAAQLPAGSVTILDYASRISYGIIELLTSGVLLVIFAKWSQETSRADPVLLKSQVQQLTLMMSFIVIPVAGILIALRQPLVAIAFQRGSFDLAMTTATASVFLFFLLGIPIDAISRIYVRLFLVWQNTSILGGLAGIRVVVTAATAFILMQTMDAAGIALADSISIFLIGLALISLANRRLGDTFSGSAVSLLKIGIGTICAAGMAALLSKLWLGSELISLVVSGVAASIIYLLVVWVLRSDQLETLIILMRPRFVRRIPQ
jgi:putative peptidoglycan lipid II flippase